MLFQELVIRRFKQNGIICSKENNMANDSAWYKENNMISDSDWYKDALYYLQWITGKSSELIAYKSWSDKFCRLKLGESFKGFYENENVRKTFSLENLTVERAKMIGFKQWDDNSEILLCPLWYCGFIKDGTKIYTISGPEYYDSEKTDKDARFGCVAFGFRLGDFAKKIIK